ncbi:hypothetical protein BKN38_08380 [Helicobacter sp. CLO-3]|uniref:tRNA uridine-5-carboxymethylaminomethyl(34) synthesis GTPase MnmE n=1 Tax=unclassified Helicobacter TaxID=2593540 RepID=UPI0008D9EEBF|nr:MULTISPECIES: tRNA uridine-5-carboxymethylaminomethyl(34) synthesis GTPase MnmE [unclassified Helicobacter]OHU81759.1 hypothetical protein BKN38_08380 [Helicobacter sp. CLO-3]
MRQTAPNALDTTNMPKETSAPSAQNMSDAPNMTNAPSALDTPNTQTAPNTQALDTIVAIATPSGIGGIAIVRLSGKDALSIALRITRAAQLTPRYATLCSLFDTTSALIDEAIVIYFQAPRSYTCEDVVEFQCHGGAIIAQKIIATCLVLGARKANAGEFTKRAVLNGRIDIAQANAISQMITTNDANFQSALISQLKGELGAFVASVREILLSALAHAEVMIDYAQEDIPEDIIGRIGSKLDDLRARLDRIYSFSRARVDSGLKLCLIGKPNVGKSSLLNTLLLYERAITSPIAGTTRDRIEEDIYIDGNLVRLIDTAGIREGADMLESQGIEKTKEALQECAIALGVFDSSRRADDEDKKVLDLLAQEWSARAQNPQKRKLEILLVLNKTDMPQIFDERAFEGILAQIVDSDARESKLRESKSLDSDAPESKSAESNILQSSAPESENIESKNIKSKKLESKGADSATHSPILRISTLDKEKSASLLHSALSERMSAINARGGEVILSATYQLESVRATSEHIAKASARLESAEIELFAYHIKDALESIAQITHPYHSEEVLDAMFGEFCLGK